MPTSLIVILHFMSIHIDFGVDLGPTKRDEPRLRVMRGMTGEWRKRVINNYVVITTCMYCQVSHKK